MSKTLFILSLFALSAGATAGQEKFALIHTDQLATMMQDSSMKVAIFDANNDKTRQESGVIPGAVMLTSSKGYDTAKVLPKSKRSKLVFYCANEQCMASHAAADRAVHAGYKDVSVLADGIQGWVKAGQKVDKP